MSRRLLLGAALLALTASTHVHAASFMATPVKLTLPAGANSTSLSLQNTADQPVLVQAEVMAWTQRGGEDVLTPSQDLVVSPPIFTVAPGASQIVRIGLMRRPHSAQEVTYRLFLQEVPKPPAGRAGRQCRIAPGVAGVRDAERPDGPQAHLGRACARRRGGTRSEQRGQRTRADHRMQTAGGRWEDIAERSLASYVLAGQTRTWTLKISRAWSGGKLTIDAQTSAGKLSAPDSRSMTGRRKSGDKYCTHRRRAA